ncbi:MAG: helix-turn-helix transcriptional regulator, partial [Frankiaceae bacterium]|nr:helix-turn-helix transcriptional regulator [Frankiaceae bacterium]
MSESSAPEQALTTVRTVDSAEAIKAIADPLRVRMLQLLMMASHRTWTVKEIAAELSQPVTKLYHHIKLLEAADLISDVETRVVSGIVEHRYRANQRSLRF